MISDLITTIIQNNVEYTKYLSIGIVKMLIKQIHGLNNQMNF